VGGLVDAPPGERGVHTPGLMDVVGPALLLVEAGRIPEAEPGYRALGPVAGWRPGPLALVSYALAVPVAIALHASSDVAALRDQLAPYRRRHVAFGGGVLYYAGPVELYTGLAAAHLDLLDEAVTDFEDAVQACAANGAAGYHAEAQYELARVLARRARPGDLPRARTLVADCARQAAALGMAPWAAKANQLIQRLAGPPAAPLTQREREVANLVAQGLTNREIAARLYLSERTAQNHVQHILTKLGLSNRSQIAVWVTSQN
jgi:DNA-binding CsgD family transcriptional regulator